MRSILPLLILLAGCSAALTSPEPRATTRTGDACIERSVRTFRALEQRTSALEDLPRPGLRERCELALLYVTAGRFAEGEALLRDILRTEPRDAGANLLLARALDRSARPDSASSRVTTSAFRSTIESACAARSVLAGVLPAGSGQRYRKRPESARQAANQRLSP